MATDNRIDQIWDLCDDLMFSGKFSELDSVLLQLNTEELDTDELLSFLTASFAAKSLLPSREGLLQKAKNKIAAQSHDSLESFELLKGLD